MTPNTWWVVTLRHSGADEDALYIVEARDPAQAMVRAEAQLREDCDIPPDTGDDDEASTIYINHIVACGAVAPQHVKTPY